MSLERAVGAQAAGGRPLIGAAVATLRAAAWLGWQTESNWASPFIFAVYTVIRPVSAAALLVVMYLVVSGGQTSGDRFAYVFLGQALFVFVSATVEAVGQAFIQDRERWQTLRYIYLAPTSPYVYLIGRGAARFAISGLGVAITLAAGLLLLGLRIDPSRVDVPLALASLLLGATGTIALGVLVAGVSLVVARHSWSLAESVAAGLHILCGAIFPVDVLPEFLRPLGLALPLTYWLEGERRALAGVRAPGMLGALSTPQVVGLLVASTLLLVAVTHVVFRTCERAARDRGLIDNTTGD